MTPVLPSPAALNLWCSTPLKWRPEMTATLSGRPEWNTGGWSELPGRFSGSPKEILRRFHRFTPILLSFPNLRPSASICGQLSGRIIDWDGASEVTFTDLPTGQVKITIAASNSKDGESAASDPATVV